MGEEDSRSRVFKLQQNADGSRYFGGWKNGAPAFLGLYYDPVDRIERGYFENGLLNGYGHRISITGELEEGQFKNGVLHGKALAFDCQSQLWGYGVFKNGDLVTWMKTGSGFPPPSFKFLKESERLGGGASNGQQNDSGASELFFLKKKSFLKLQRGSTKFYKFFSLARASTIASSLALKFPVNYGKVIVTDKHMKRDDNAFLKKEKKLLEATKGNLQEEEQSETFVFTSKNNTFPADYKKFIKAKRFYSANQKSVMKEMVFEDVPCLKETIDMNDSENYVSHKAQAPLFVDAQVQSSIETEEKGAGSGESLQKETSELGVQIEPEKAETKETSAQSDRKTFEETGIGSEKAIESEPESPRNISIQCEDTKEMKDVGVGETEREGKFFSEAGVQVEVKPNKKDSNTETEMISKREESNQTTIKDYRNQAIGSDKAIPSSPPSNHEVSIQCDQKRMTDCGFGSEKAILSVCASCHDLSVQCEQKPGVDCGLGSQKAIETPSPSLHDLSMQCEAKQVFSQGIGSNIVLSSPSLSFHELSVQCGENKVLEELGIGSDKAILSPSPSNKDISMQCDQKQTMDFGFGSEKAIEPPSPSQHNLSVQCEEKLVENKGFGSEKAVLTPPASLHDFSMQCEQSPGIEQGTGSDRAIPPSCQEASMQCDERPKADQCFGSDKAILSPSPSCHSLSIQCEEAPLINQEIGSDLAIPPSCHEISIQCDDHEVADCGFGSDKAILSPSPSFHNLSIQCEEVPKRNTGFGSDRAIPPSSHDLSAQCDHVFLLNKTTGDDSFMQKSIHDASVQYESSLRFCDAGVGSEVAPSSELKDAEIQFDEPKPSKSEAGALTDSCVPGSSKEVALQMAQTMLDKSLGNDSFMESFFKKETKEKAFQFGTPSPFLMENGVGDSKVLGPEVQDISVQNSLATSMVSEGIGSDSFMKENKERGHDVSVQCEKSKQKDASTEVAFNKCVDMAVETCFSPVQSLSSNSVGVQIDSNFSNFILGSMNLESNASDHPEAKSKFSNALGVPDETESHTSDSQNLTLSSVSLGGLNQAHRKLNRARISGAITEQQTESEDTTEINFTPETYRLKEADSILKAIQASNDQSEKRKLIGTLQDLFKELLCSAAEGIAEKKEGFLNDGAIRKKTIGNCIGSPFTDPSRSGNKERIKTGKMERPIGSVTMLLDRVTDVELEQIRKMDYSLIPETKKIKESLAYLFQ